MNTETPQTKLATKYSALQKAKKKLTSYREERILLEEKITSAEESVRKGEEEYEIIQELAGELEILKKEDKVLGKRAQEIFAHYESIQWSPNLADDEKLENDAELKELIRKRRTLEARMTEIPKEINKVYYRR